MALMYQLPIKGMDKKINVLDYGNFKHEDFLYLLNDDTVTNRIPDVSIPQVVGEYDEINKQVILYLNKRRLMMNKNKLKTKIEDYKICIERFALDLDIFKIDRRIAKDIKRLLYTKLDELEDELKLS